MDILWSKFPLKVRKLLSAFLENAVVTQLSPLRTEHSFPLGVSPSLWASDSLGVTFTELNSAPLELSTICLHPSTYNLVFSPDK